MKTFVIRRLATACLAVMMLPVLAWGEAAAAPASAERQGRERPVAPYSMVCYSLNNDEAYMRRYIGSLRDLGCTQALALVYWWQHEPLEGDWWKGVVPEESFGDGYLRTLDLFVGLCEEMGIRPAFRLGSFREWQGKWHPGDPSGDVGRYAEWVGRLAARYRGRIDHYVIGDEENKEHAESGFDGSARQYLDRFLIPLAQAIRSADPQALISSCGASSSPATEWNLELIRLGLPQYADGIACNLWFTHFEDLESIEQLMASARAAWPEVRFFANGVGYVERKGLHDPAQAARVAQTMFTLWDIGWDSAPLYLYFFSYTADTDQDFGLMSLPAEEGKVERTDAWYAYQAIAHTFRNRDSAAEPDFAITLEPAQRIEAADGSTISMAPPDPFVRTFVQRGDELLIYLAYRNTRSPLVGSWDVVIDSGTWERPELVPLNSYRDRIALPHDKGATKLTIRAVKVSTLPTILILRRTP